MPMNLKIQMKWVKFLEKYKLAKMTEDKGEN